MAAAGTGGRGMGVRRDGRSEGASRSEISKQETTK